MLKIELDSSSTSRRRLGALVVCLMVVFLCGVVFFLSLSVARVLDARLRAAWASFTGQAVEVLSTSIPVSTMPGPERRWEPIEFVLDNENAQTMQGRDDPLNERWCDISGNFYASEFIRGFSYARRNGGGPVVRVRIEARSDTLRGRLEARRLKPNFAYQIKLLGDFRDRRSFERIGFTGRWRLPGRGTNYTDEDYLAFPAKRDVEAYVLFDFFVTDGDGNAVREFALDSSLHVLWNGARQRGPARVRHVLPVIVDASDPAVYARPKQARDLEFVWAERERGRYDSASQRIRLPPGTYHAALVLTEESFHSQANDGGFWATVARVPVNFEVVGPTSP